MVIMVYPLPGYCHLQKMRQGCLGVWHGRWHIQSLSEEVRNTKEAMDTAQREVECNPMLDVLSRQVGLATEAFWTAVRLEEASLRQKSRIRWLQLGDQNTTFFHRSVRSRMSCNSLLSLVNSDGSRVSSHDGVVQLTVPISREEVRRVLFSMDSGKAPGPDRFSVGLFKGVWSVVGEDFCDVVLHFLETCYLPLGINATAITLIPKRRGAERMDEFQPISCCNELVRGYHLNSSKPRCTVKVDLQKAYDFVNWDFLFGLLIAIGTPSKFVSWIRACVTSPMFSIMINGSLKGVFHGRKGVKKSSIFVAGVSNEAASHLAASMGFVLGNLPVRYLGLPLLTGRLQLVRSVLRSIQVYSASVIVLPAYVHNEVEKILRSYLWRGKEEGRGGVKVAWVEVCHPFEEGRFAIQDGHWNKRE
ncbi:uncharacterized protein E5676_scaffold605G00020 [Cucumis melo var. makuwa]|uniref:Uncharacterized protein n=1 Tax=Cucumis melo var. makuwa TaxID=1194695 RepID=A0A5D3DIC0_CUCMM|nr:uncharacterized protein E5676_scaffold605G00020 [Cucumis melo var. makuwa]